MNWTRQNIGDEYQDIRERVVGYELYSEMTKDEWAEKQKELLRGLPDETLISIYDCHI